MSDCKSRFGGRPKLAVWAGIFIVFIALFDVSAADAAKLLRIGYQKSGAFLLVKSEGSLEKALALLGYRVEWKEFTSGPRIVEALNAGSVDLGHSGDCPIILAQSAGVPALYLGNTKADADSAAIIVPENSPLQNPADLKGKKIAFDRGSSGHYLLGRVLESVGLTLSDIHPVYLSAPDARAAFASGAVDAWSIWDPFYAAAEVGSHARTLVSTKEFSPHREFYFAQKDFIESHPEIVQPLFEVLNATGARAQKDPIGTAKFLSDKLGISLDVMTKVQLRNTRYNAYPISDKVIAEQQRVADFLYQQGVIKTPIKVTEAIYHPLKPLAISAEEAP